LRKYITEILAGVSLALSIFFLVHQRLCTEGGWFNWEQFIHNLHHEHLMVLCFVAAIALLVGKYVSSERSSHSK
jgi:hypothetical protein